MIIDFNSIEAERLANFKGGEGEYIAKRSGDDTAKIMLGRLEPGSSIGLHTHEENCEVIYVISGIGDLIYDDTTEKVMPGQCHYCPKGHSHSLINNGSEDLVFFAAVPEVR